MTQCIKYIICCFDRIYQYAVLTGYMISVMVRNYVMVTKDNVNHINVNHAKMSKSLLADLKTEKYLYSSIHV